MYFRYHELYIYSLGVFANFGQIFLQPKCSQKVELGNPYCNQSISHFQRYGCGFIVA